MHFVDSSNVEAIGFAADTQEIYIRFLSGRTYAYGGANEALFSELQAAPSIGSFVNRVLKPHHPFRAL